MYTECRERYTRSMYPLPTLYSTPPTSSTGTRLPHGSHHRDSMESFLFSSPASRYLWQAVGRSARTDRCIRFFSLQCATRLSSEYIHGSLRRRRPTPASLTAPFEIIRRFSTTHDPQSQHKPQSKRIHVWEQTISSFAANAPSNSAGVDGQEIQSGRGRVLYKPVINYSKHDSMGWEVYTTGLSHSKTNRQSSHISSLMNSYEKGDIMNVRNLPFIHPFLPAHYPHSVCSSYASYASYCFLGSIAGSSAMVLSTQALLIAVGVGTQSAAPMAAALNWVMKDGVGQLGGVIFASQLGKGGMDFDYWRGKLGKLTLEGERKSRQRGNFQRGTADSNPKRWRMVAALALDLSTLLEICTPMMGPEWFLPCASIANIGKNVGFLAASASRAAIHQSLSMGGSSPQLESSEPETCANAAFPKTSVSSNLGDVTAKSGSQSIVASLLGTAIGIFLSQTFCADYGTAGILAGFVVLSTVHQACTYKAIKVVPLRSLDRHRLHIVLTSYISEKAYHLGSNQDGTPVKTLTPAQVAEKESFLPMMPPDDSVRWLTVGDSLLNICPSGITELERLLLARKSAGDDRSTNFSDFAFDSKEYEKYILKINPPSEANGDGMVQLTYLEGATDFDILRGMFHSYVAHAFMSNNCPYSDGSSNECIGAQILTATHAIMTCQMPRFAECLQEVGWHIGAGFVTVECGSSHRLMIKDACE